MFAPPFLFLNTTKAIPPIIAITPIVELTISTVLDDLESDSSSALSASSLVSSLVMLVAELSVPSCWLVFPDETAELSAAIAVPSRVEDSVTNATDAV